MAAVAGEYKDASSAPARLGGARLLIWCMVGVAALAAAFFFLQPTRLSASLGDTDDAMRLIEVRELIDGRSWFDNTLPRFGGAEPLQSHWSRLIDLPLAALLTAFDLMMPEAGAELALRIVWPLTLLLAFLYLLGRETDIRGGAWAALLAIALAVTCITDIVQFVPGRIDHHNAMILCATIGILRLARSLDDPEAGWSAGIFLGLGVAIGYESLALTVASIGASVLFALLPGRSLLGPSRAAVTFAAALAIALAMTTAPDNFFVEHCDSLSMNLVMLAAIAAAGVCAVQAFEDRLSLVARLALLAATAGVGLLVYGWAEPACLAGPFGQVDRALFPLWLDRVLETQSLFSAGRDARLLAVTASLYFIIGVYGGVKLIRRERGDTVRFDLLILIVAILLSCWQVKLLPYATTLAVPLVAVWLTRPSEAPDPRPLDRRTVAVIAAGVLLVVGTAAWLTFTGEAPKGRAETALKKTQDCAASAAIRPLADLPAGLAVADVNLGPYLVALTRLDALSAPYHRLGPAIMAAHRILHAPPAQAETLLREVGARYVIACPGLDSTRPKGGSAPDALLSLLLADKPPPFLAPVALSGSTPLRVWRVVE